MFYLTMLIFVKEGKETIFHEFEESVIPLLSNYNGTLQYRIRPTKKAYLTCAGKQPYEIHVIAFSTVQDFDNYTNDPVRKKFMHLKEASIETTIVLKGTIL